MIKFKYHNVNEWFRASLEQVESDIMNGNEPLLAANSDNIDMLKDYMTQWQTYIDEEENN